LIAGGLLGVILLLFGGLGGDEEEGRADPVLVRISELESYEQALEEEIAALCDAVAGVSRVRVKISFDAGYAVRYVKNSEGSPATVGNGSNEEALFETVVPPRVAGVGIVCVGGGNAQIRQELCELVCAAVGVSANRVFITGA
jgi:stage III sporulation protein AG